MAKYGMSMCVLGMAAELKADNIAVNALWPRTGNKQLKFYSKNYVNIEIHLKLSMILKVITKCRVSLFEIFKVFITFNIYQNYL